MPAKKVADKVEWKAPEFRYFEKEASWFGGSLIIAAALAITAIFQDNFLFLIFIVIAEALVLHWGRQSPRENSYEINSQGIVENGVRFYAFREFKAFDIIADDRLAELILLPRRQISVYARILIPLDRVDDVVEKAAESLEHFEYEESFFEHLANRLRL